MCLGKSCGFFFFVAAFNPASFKAWHTVWALTSILLTSLSSQVSWTALSTLPEVIVRSSLHLSVALSFAGHPPRLFGISDLDFARILSMVEWLTPNCAAILCDESPLSSSERILL